MSAIRTQTEMSIMGTIFLSYRRALQKKLVPFGSTLKQHYVLQQLIKRERMQPSEIAEELYCDRPTASVVIRNLQKRGWIKKEKDPDNGKFFWVTITGKGRKQLEKTKGALLPDIDPLSYLNADERKQLAVLLRKMRNGLMD